MLNVKWKVLHALEKLSVEKNTPKVLWIRKLI